MSAFDKNTKRDIMWVTSIIQVLNVLKRGFSNTVVCSMYKLIIEKM